MSSLQVPNRNQEPHDVTDDGDLLDSFMSLYGDDPTDPSLPWLNLPYEVHFSERFEWPSLTVQWFPDAVVRLGKDYSLQKLLTGTHTVGRDRNFLTLTEVMLPHGMGFDLPQRKMKITQQINHEGVINRARYMPQNPHLIATTGNSGVYIFDSSKHPLKPPPDGLCNPELRLKGHTEEGFGLSWNVLGKDYLLSCSDDSRICFWDINAAPTDNAIKPQNIFQAHEGPVQDVAWHLKNGYTFGSVGDDKQLLIWDIRAKTPLQSVVAHRDMINCLAFDPFNEWILATGSVDTTVELFDLRILQRSWHTLKYHKDSVSQIGWNPNKMAILASSCAAGRLLVWDISRICEKQSRDEERPPELWLAIGGRKNNDSDCSPDPLKEWMFEEIAALNWSEMAPDPLHESNVSDFSWNPAEEHTVASVDEECNMQIWQMAKQSR